MNEKILFNDGWSFAKTGPELASREGLEFTPVSVPHDWLIYNTGNLYEDSIGWYLKNYTYSLGDYRVILCYDGVYMDSSLYVNGRLIGTWKYGYSSFEFDITDALHEGSNEILLRVVHQSPNSRWYSGAGIYRNVWLRTRGSTYIETNGVYVSTQQLGDSWQVELDTTLMLNTGVRLSHIIRYGEDVLASSSQVINPKDKNELINRQLLSVREPYLWNPAAPFLYQLITVLEDESGNPIEIITNNLGFRTISLDPDQDLILNGSRLKLHGVCEHHDLGALGAAFNKTALIRRLRLLKEMGVNAIRTSHNMPAPELMDLADEMGFLIISEAFDMWERPKTTYDYARFFKDWVEADVKSWVMRDRNHPSLLLWSIGNEIYDTHADDRGMEITRLLKTLVTKYDPRKNASVTFASNYMPWENTQKCADILKVVGYNYAAGYYRDHHIKYPDWVIYGSETCSTVQSRGIYHFPFSQSLMADDDEQCSSLGNSSTSWGAASTEDCIISDRDVPFSLGQFIWTGFDYIGEPTPYHTKNSYFGQLDTATFKKDSYYIFQAEWTDYRTGPMVHIFPYWDFNMGQLIDVRVCSNAPCIELFLNGISKGKYYIDHVHGKELIGTWRLPYEPGGLKALAYDEDGKIIAGDIRRSFGDPARIKLTADKDKLISDGQDIIFVEISMEDKDGNPVENANNRVFVNVTGAGCLIGLDNGDSTDYDQYKGKSRRLFSGKLMALIGSTAEAGRVCIEVSSKGLDTVCARFEAIPAPKAPIGVRPFVGNTDLPIVTGQTDELPLRKLEIVVNNDGNSGNVLDADRREITARAILHPANTSYRDVEWSIVNASGIPISNAKIEGSGLEVRVLAMADGDFYLRCSSRNGTQRTKLISHLEFTIKGLGTFYKNPYDFIYGGLYDYSRGTVGNGNEKGIATMYDGETIVGYQNIDFGPYGSDKITIPIFALNDEAYPIAIWEGVPREEGSSLLAEVIYQKPSIWNVYQEATYTLPRRLKGVCTLSLVLHNKVHIKGFSFEKINRAFEINYAPECDHIYGDDYRILAGNLLHVGNNISLEYNYMDFSATGSTRLTIHGRSHIDLSTVIVLVENDKEQGRRLISFKKSEGLSTQTFNIDKIDGSCRITFIFLPGSNFDFAWFKFDS